MRWMSLVLAFTVCPSFAAFAQEPSEEGEQRVERRVFRLHAAGKGFLGVQILPMTPELRRHFGVPEDVGVMVSSVDEDGPAAAAGIQVGDVLTAVDGGSVESTRALSRSVREKEAGDTVTVELYRNGGLESYPVTIAERERDVVDFSSDFDFIAEMPDIEHDIVIKGRGLHLDDDAREAMREAMRHLEERFESEEWKEKVERLEELDFSDFQERMREVETRLKELEAELKKSPDRF